MSQNPLTRRLLAVAAVLALIAVAAAGTSQIDRMIAGLEWVRGAGPVGWAAFLTVYVLATVAAVPASFLHGAAGFLLGPLTGFAFASVASTGSSCISFLLGRTALRSLVAERASRDPLFRAVDASIGEGGAYLVALLRLSPLAPFNLVSYGLGVTRVPLRQYVLGTWVGSIPPIALFAYIGSTVGDLADLLGGGAVQGLAPRVVVLVCTLVASLLVARFAQRALGRALESRAEAAP